VLSYPFWDTLLVLAIVLIIRQCAERLFHPALLLCGAGLLADIWADSAYAHFTALGIYHSGTFYIDPFWYISALLIGLSALYQYAALARRAASKRTQPTERAARKEETAPRGTKPRRFVLLQSALIYLPLCVLLALTLGSEVIDDKPTGPFLVVLTGLVGLLVAARYLFATYENELLLEEREQRRQEIDRLKDQFLMTASHELRTPLTSVQGYLELLVQFYERLPPEQHREFLHRAQRNCDELVELLDNVMDAGRLETEAAIRPTHLESVSVQDMIQSVLDLIEPHLTREQRAAHCAIPAHLSVQADPARLRQVLLNISVNALKYSPPGTPLAYSAHAVPDASAGVVISVTDKGQGIAPADQARLFQRFVRLESDMNSPIRGSGLGLYISRHLTEAMGGHIWIESSGMVGEGSTFHVWLPIAE